MTDATTTRTETEKLFSEFPVPTLEQWREEVVRLLKGAPFDKKMLASTYEGITLQPIYTQEDVKDLPFQDTLPGEWPYLRGTEPLGKRVSGWLVAQELPFPEAKAFNEALLQDLERGQNAVNISLDAASRQGLDPDQAEASQVGRGGTSLSTFADAVQLLEGVDPSLPLFVAASGGAVPAAALLVAALKAKQADLSKARLSLGFDPLGALASKGSLPMSLDQAYDQLADLTGWAKAESPRSLTLVACGRPWHEAGGNAVQELAFTLASAVATLRALEARGVRVEDAAGRMLIRQAVGGNFFMEIAKLRAMRVLWAQVVRACGGSDEAAKIHLHAMGGKFNKTQFDPHVNILRGTTEAFAAVVGGADSIHVAPWDVALSQVPGDLGRRLARNTQIMLREESRLDQVADLAGGSWAVETLTHQLCVAAWKLFQEVDAMGGLKAALDAGFPQAKIADVATARRKAIAQRTNVIVGNNQYANPTEALPEVRTLDHEALKATLGPKAAAARKGAVKGTGFQALVEAAPNATLGELAVRGEGPKVEPLKAQRAAEVFEGLRKAVLAYRAKHQGPQVFLANLGPVGTYMPRLDFTRGLFQVGGFEVADQAWFKTPEEAAEAALASGAPVVVAVGLDATYVEAVPVLAKALKAGGVKTLLVAGLLKEQEEAFKAAGVQDFVHVRSDVQAVLSGLAKTLEVF
ncbi:MAG TPA: methylmalonyl-CoA mutase family protein [Holophaga sp.]|nr:methylmalonyl-CoA mutase family protein [Holophaga sp.]HPS66445.1 methylmalonyl-CoA mutase family protein [Holophaga sp.]